MAVLGLRVVGVRLGLETSCDDVSVAGCEAATGVAWSVVMKILLLRGANASAKISASMPCTYGNVPYLLRRSANKARKGVSMLIRFLESTFFLKICKQARGRGQKRKQRWRDIGEMENLRGQNRQNTAGGGQMLPPEFLAAIPAEALK